MLSEMARSMSRLLYLVCDYNYSIMQITWLPFTIIILILDGYTAATVERV